MCPVLILYVLIGKNEGTIASKDNTIRVLYIGGPETINQIQAAQNYINSSYDENYELPDGYHLQIIYGDPKVWQA